MFDRILAQLVLPAEISLFERNYLRRMNRIALLFFFAHLPVMMVVAALSGTNVVKAALYTAFVLVGPTVAFRTLSNPRAIARVSAFAAMCMGGVLVHVGQGPMQIEMHFYFFVLIALLAVFADPIVIIVAAVTVALHHLVLYFVLPTSVFNYQASIWAVLVHALFVVLESVAACFVARSFFDNVIGLERIVAQRTGELASRNDQMRIVMDNVEAGLVTVGLDGTMSSERSLALERWLGKCEPTDTLWSYVRRSDETAATWLEMSWEMLRDDLVPTELALDQCPRRLRAGERTLALVTTVLGAGTDERRLLVVMTDVTGEIERERLEAEQREIVTLCEHAVKDRFGLAEFMRESGAMIEAIERGTTSSHAELRRLLHTIKGNCAIFGATTVATLCHEIETHVEEEGCIRETDRAALGASWRKISSKLSLLRGEQSGQVDVELAEHAAVVQSLRSGTPATEVADSIDAWRRERAGQRLSRVAEHARGIAKRLERAPLEIVTEHDAMRLPDEDWSSFWAAFVHLVRNAVDHGIEPADERIAKGKPAGGRLTLRAHQEAGGVSIEVEDDGRGIDWDAVAARARALHLPASTREELVEALFAEGLSTKKDVSDLSGRGVGMSAIRAECVRLGAQFSLAPVPGGGTRFRIEVPRFGQRRVTTAA